MLTFTRTSWALATVARTACGWTPPPAATASFITRPLTGGLELEPRLFLLYRGEFGLRLLEPQLRLLRRKRARARPVLLRKRLALHLFLRL